MMKMRMIASHVFLKDYKTNFVVLNEFREKYMTFLSKLRIKRKPKSKLLITKLTPHQKHHKWHPLVNCGKCMANGIKW